jgi:hypothetical protein
MLYQQTLKQLAESVLPNYHSMRSTAKLLMIQTLAIAYNKPAGEVARDLLVHMKG